MNFCKVAIICCSLGILYILWIEYAIYLDYMSTTGKTQALFGITELVSYGHKFYAVFAGFLGLILCIMGFRSKEKRNLKWMAFSLSLFTIGLPFLRVWQWFV